jgi:hypothetical protein
VLGGCISALEAAAEHRRQQLEFSGLTGKTRTIKPFHGSRVWERNFGEQCDRLVIRLLGKPRRRVSARWVSGNAVN